MAKQLTMRILGAAIVLIALSFAPSVAKAHGGHVHQAAAAPAAVDHDHTTPSQVEPVATPASLELAETGQIDTSSDRNCVGGCCSYAYACCGAAGLPGAVELVSFPRTAMRVALPPSQRAASLAPDSLKRPPKHFT
jgi:hypothetical protein